MCMNSTPIDAAVGLLEHVDQVAEADGSIDAEDDGAIDGLVEVGVGEAEVFE